MKDKMIPYSLHSRNIAFVLVVTPAVGYLYLINLYQVLDKIGNDKDVFIVKLN